MKGKDLKDFLRQEGINLAELAQQLGFSNDQRLHSALKAEDVKSGLIEQIAKATNKSVGYFYNENPTATAETNSVAVSGNDNEVSLISERFLSLLEKKDEQIERKDTQLGKRDEQIDRLLTIVEDMSRRKEAQP